MNRARKRKQPKLAADEVQAIKQEITTQAIEVAYEMVLSLGLYTLRKNNGFGKKRLREFKNNFDSTIIAYNKGKITKKGMLQELREQDIEVKF